MIIIRVWEGLGNQLFQYAFAKRLEMVKGKKVFLDTNLKHVKIHEERGVVRKFTLDKFNISLKMAEEIDKEGWRYLSQKNFWDKIKLYLAKHSLWRYNFFEQEQPYARVKNHFWGNYYIKGWFQSEEYFRDIRNILLKEFTPKEKVKLSHKLYLVMKSSTTVSLHIRRGDYKKLGLIIPIQYYYDAISYMNKVVEKPVYIIFTDDIVWVKKNLAISEEKLYVSEEGNYEDYEELLIMSKCTNNIIANSTFSWWGAWLNQNNKKIVIAPKTYNKCTPKEWKHV